MLGGVRTGVDAVAVTKLSPAAQVELREFYDLAFGQAWRYLARITGGDKALTEDLIHDVMFTVGRDLANGRSPKTDPGWIVTVARNRFLNHVRATDRAEAKALASFEQQQRVALDDTSLTADRARQLLAMLPLDQRAAVTLRHIDGYGVADIAYLMGRTIEATESLIARGIRSLRQHKSSPT